MIMLFRLFSLLVACRPDASSADGVNLIPLIIPHPRTSLSSTWRNFSADYAIDGREDTEPDSCYCCAGTSSNQSWWRLSLGASYLIESIIFIGRSDQTAQSTGFSIYNDFSNASSDRQLLYQNNDTTGFYFTIPLNPPVVLRHLEISSPKILTICELKLFQSVQYINLTNATASMSSEYQRTDNSRTYYAWYAKDGQEDTQPDTCFCCAGANKSPSYWRLDLGKKYLVQGFVFIGRDDNLSGQSRNFNILTGFSNSSDTTEVIYQNRHSSGSRFTYYFPAPILMERLEIKSSRTLTVCEFKLVKAVCAFGKFGADCRSSCHCRGGGSCDIVTGKCPGQLCAAGWKGLSCSEACDARYFGNKCISPCHCRNNESCDHETGSCTSGCAAGWRSTNCSLPCDAGYFGNNCSSPCHCRNNESCDHETGRCTSGCAAGWRSTNCSLPCPEGTYGLNCLKCGHCKSPSDCDKNSGECRSGCQIGYSGRNCSTDDNLIQEIRSQVSAKIHPVYSPYIGTNAIDQNERTDADVCRCCAGADHGPSWWRLDLGNQYSIDTVIFIGRSDEASYQSRGFTIYDEYGNLSKPHHVIYKNTNSSGYHFVKIFDPPIILQRLEINKTSTGSIGVLTVCEFKLLESEFCPVPYFDRHCRQECHCADQQKCKKIDGICQTPGCDPGWRGAACDIPCDDFSFGPDCKFPCHCNVDDRCDRFNGNCSSDICASGWEGDNCSIPCDNASFGPNCQFVCHCNANDTCDSFQGNCSSDICAPGWKGDNCSIPCESGWFGQNCSYQCHCLHDEPCDPVGGNCMWDLCSPGWQNKNCSTACDNGTFGQNCSSPCHCLLDRRCDPIRGNCKSDVCSPGWRDKNCSTACESGKFGQNCSSLCHCLHDQHCDSASGYCPSGVCSPGWRDKSCSTACSSNTYGQNCSSSCHCNNCHHINGSCNTEQCYSKWKGKYCNETVEALKQSDTSPDTAVIIGPIVAVLILGAIAAVLILYRRHAMKKKADAPANNLTDLQVSKPTRNRVVQNNLVPDTKPKIKAKRTLEKQDEHMYYSYATRGNTIHIQDLWDFINEAYLDKCEKLHLEFQKLPSGLIHECVEANRPENIRKNRYKGIMAYDHSRVMLQRDDPSASTYVNACYIDGFAKPKKFIASQGPQENTADDFCEMVFQKHISLIVMLTNVIELGTRKCVQYWSADEGEVLQFGEIVIITAKITTFPDYIIRELEFSKAEKKPHRITQVHFTAWPDKDVPDDAWHLVNVWRKVNSLYGNKPEPIVVHCSAGVGRTGTFIALSNLHEQARAVEYIQPLEVITQLRNQRVSMVQTKDQYVFVHEAVAESLYLGVKPIKSRDFESVHTSLLSREKATGEIGLEQQFLFLQKNKNADSDSEYYNIHSASEIDEYRPKATPSVSGDRSDCMFIQNYTAKDTFMVSKIAAGNAMSQELQKTVTRTNIKTVISLSIGHRHGKTNQTDEDDIDNDDLLKPSDTKKGKHHMEKTFELKHHKTNHEQKQLKLFEFLMWRDGARIPTDPNHVIDLLNAVQRWQPVAEEAHPILVTCETGFERSGLICALLSEFERIRVKEEVNLFETVKNMKTMNSQFIPNYDQYRFCHAAVLEYIRQSDVYMNV